MSERVCHKCSETKPLTEFFGKKSKACKRCHAVAMSEWYRANRERILARRKELRAPITRHLTAARADRMADPTKECAKCKQRLLREELAKGGKDRRRGVCKSCWAASLRKYRHRNSESHRAYARAYRATRRDKQFDKQLQLKYGITSEQYKDMLDTQDGVCGACKRPETVIDKRTQSPRRLAVDHCHKSGRVRGLLCARCNTASGMIGDNPMRLIALISYLTPRMA